jgi:hypothetical protein
VKKGFKIGLAVLMVFALSLGLMGCVNNYKSTGGGFLEDCYGNKVTFGYNAQVNDGAIKGQFQLVDHACGLVVHGTFDDYTRVLGQYCLSGDLKVNGEDSGQFALWVDDNGEPGTSDLIFVKLWIPGPDKIYTGMLDGGNIQVH